MLVHAVRNPTSPDRVIISLPPLVVSFGEFTIDIAVKEVGGSSRAESRHYGSLSPHGPQP